MPQSVIITNSKIKRRDEVENNCQLQNFFGAWLQRRRRRVKRKKQDKNHKKRVLHFKISQYIFAPRFFQFSRYFQKVNCFEERIIRGITPVFGFGQKSPIKKLLAKEVDVTGARARGNTALTVGNILANECFLKSQLSQLKHYLEGFLSNSYRFFFMWQRS